MNWLRWKVSWLLLNIFGLIFVVNCILQLYEKLSKNTSSYNQVKVNLNVKIDWNNYELMISDSQRSGYGEHGKGEVLTDLDEVKMNQELFETFGMSVVISDKISVNRSVPDFRHPDCLKIKYSKHLPRVSIIIIFNNEIFSVFKRTLHSLYNRTPHELIEEVILVNDCSTLDYLYGPLEVYIKENFDDLDFRIINLKQRSGLMKARVAGAKAARSEFLFVMEPHCEMTYNWLPPLIEPLLQDKRVVAVPIVDNIYWGDLSYYEHLRGRLGSRGVFNWELEYQTLKRFPFNKEEKLNPFLTPIMTGGIFMIRKEYFFEIGPYDEELLIWGAENIEMSLKVHLCGGKLLEVPCSRIGHVYRDHTSSRKHESGIDFVAYNRKRIIEVWFDEFKEFAYMKNPKALEIDVGDLSKAKKLREKLKCKPFKYFLDVIAFDILKIYPTTTPPFASGHIKLRFNDLCLEFFLKPQIFALLNECSKNFNEMQLFELSWYRDIRLKTADICLDYSNAAPDFCHLQGINQLLYYNITTGQISCPFQRACLEGDVHTKKLKFSKCNEFLNHQSWDWSSVNVELLKSWNTSGRPFDGNMEFHT